MPGQVQVQETSRHVSASARNALTSPKWHLLLSIEHVRMFTERFQRQHTIAPQKSMILKAKSIMKSNIFLSMETWSMFWSSTGAVASTERQLQASVASGMCAKLSSPPPRKSANITNRTKNWSSMLVCSHYFSCRFESCSSFVHRWLVIVRSTCPPATKPRMQKRNQVSQLQIVSAIACPPGAWPQCFHFASDGPENCSTKGLVASTNPSNPSIH